MRDKDGKAAEKTSGIPAFSRDAVCFHRNTIRQVRENCSAFNPSEHDRLMEPGETGKNVGIRLVYRIAKDVRYQNLLGMNVLTIRI